MANILTIPESGIFFDGNTAGAGVAPVLTGNASGVAIQYDGYAGVEINSSATGVNYLDRFSVEGTNGRLFGVTDEVTGTVFSVNDAAGLPIIEVESTSTTDTITMGTYNSNALVVAGDSVGVGINNPSYPLEVAGSGTVSFAYQRTDVSGPKKWGFHSDSYNTYWHNITDNVLAMALSNAGDLIAARDLTARVGSFKSIDASASTLMNLLCNDGNNAATFRTTVSGRVFEIRSQNSGTLKFDSTSSTFTGDVTVNGSFKWATTGNSFTYSNDDSNGFYMERVGTTDVLSDMRFQARASGAGNYSWIKIKPSNQSILLATNGADRLTINSSGNATFTGTVTATHFYGDGSNLTNLPSGGGGTDNTKLPLAGGTMTGAIDSHASDSGVILKSGNSSATGTPDQFFLKHNLGNVELGNSRGNINITSGNVGIGTTSPFSKLSINSNGAPTTSGNVASTGLTIHNGSGGTAIQIGTNDSAYSYIQSTYVNASNNLRELRFILGSQTSLRLDTSNNAHFTGNVTINAGNLFLANSSSRISNGANGEIGFNYNTGATGGLAWYGGGTSSTFSVTNTGNLSLSGHIYVSQPKTISFANAQTIRDNGGGGLAIRVPIYRLDLIAGTDAGNGHITFQTNNGTERMRVSNGGNVGIGTTSPGKELDVVGTVRAVDTSGNDQHQLRPTQLISYATDAIINAQSAGDDVRLNTQSNTVLIATAEGDVGIGTTSPASTLEIEAPSSANGTELKITSAFGESPKILSFDYVAANTNTSVAQIIGFGRPSTSGGPYMQFKVHTGSTLSEAMRITSSGNVGIGTTSPAVDLQIGDGTVDKTLRVFHSDNTYTQISGYGLFMSRGSSYIRPTADNSKGLYIGSSNYQWNLIAQDATNHTFSTNGSESVRITSSGNVGIGTTSPDHKLHVKGDVTIDNESSSEPSMLHFNATNKSNHDPTARINFWEGDSHTGTYTGSHAYIEYNGSGAGGGDGYLAIGGNTDSGANSDIMVINRLGRVGIGVASPTSPLTIKSNSVSSNDSALTIQGNSNTNAIVKIAEKATDGARFHMYDGGVEKIAFYTDGTANHISAGNVGIGTTGPNAKLHTKVGTSNSAAYDSSVGLLVEGGTRGIVQINSTSDAYFMFGDAAQLNRAWFGYNHATDQLLLHTGSTISMDGNVGIGTTNPTKELQVVGEIKATSKILVEDSSNSRLEFASSISNQARISAHKSNLGQTLPLLIQAEGIKFGTVGGGEKMRMDANGNVGIGITSPEQLLTVAGGSISVSGNTGTARQILELTTASTVATIKASYQGSSSFGDLAFQTSSSERMRITSGGNVGIGVTDPDSRLEIKGSGTGGGGTLRVKNSNDSLLLQVTDNGVVSVPNNYFYVSSSQGAYVQNALRVRGSLLNDQGTLSITGDVSFDSYTLFVDSAYDRVGVGSSSPSYKLDVNGGIRAGGKVTYHKGAGSLDTTGYAVAGLTSSNNGESACFTFTCYGHTGKYQKIVYSCHNTTGTWNTQKVIDEGTNDFDVAASANGSTITFTFKSRSGTKSYSPRVVVEAAGAAINNTYA